MTSATRKPTASTGHDKSTATRELSLTRTWRWKRVYYPQPQVQIWDMKEKIYENLMKISHLSPQQPAWPISLDIATNAVLSSMQASRVLPPAFQPTQCLRRQGTSSWPGISHAAAQYPRSPCSALLRYGHASPTHFIWSCCVQSHGLFRDTPSALFDFFMGKNDLN